MDLTGLEIDLVAACLKESVFTEGLRCRGIRFCELSGNIRNLKANFRMFSDLLRERNYDAVHLNLYQGLSLYYAVLAEKAGVPIRIAHSHNTALRKSSGRALKLLLHKAGRAMFTRAATELWACSSAAAEFLFDPQVMEERGYRFIPNGIETQRFRFDPVVREQVRAELGLMNSFVIGNVGRLCYQKNQDFLLDVFAEVLKRKPDSRLLLVGEGEDEDKLKKKAQRLGLAEKVLFYGTTDRVERLYWAIDVFAFPSRFEGLGIAAVEAQAAGLPVVCSEQVPEEALLTVTTFCVEENDALSWANKLLSFSVIAVRENGTEGCQVFEVMRTAKEIRKIYMLEEVS